VWRKCFVIGKLRFFWVGKAKVVDREDVDAWIEAQKQLEELRKTPALTDAQAQAFFEGVEKDEDGNIIVRLWLRGGLSGPKNLGTTE
jgi:hypothetical protein